MYYKDIIRSIASHCSSYLLPVEYFVHNAYVHKRCSKINDHDRPALVYTYIYIYYIMQSVKGRRKRGNRECLRLIILYTYSYVPI